jgi:hypothetical protein
MSTLWSFDGAGNARPDFGIDGSVTVILRRFEIIAASSSCWIPQRAEAFCVAPPVPMSLKPKPTQCSAEFAGIELATQRLLCALLTNDAHQLVNLIYLAPRRLAF